jgi:hypothetical protein
VRVAFDRAQVVARAGTGARLPWTPAGSLASIDVVALDAASGTGWHVVVTGTARPSSRSGVVAGGPADPRCCVRVDLELVAGSRTGTGPLAAPSDA